MHTLESQVLQLSKATYRQLKCCTEDSCQLFTHSMHSDHNYNILSNIEDKEDQSLKLALGQPRVWSVSDFIFSASANEGGWPVLSLTVSSSHWQCTVSVLIIAESARRCKWSRNLEPNFSSGQDLNLWPHVWRSSTLTTGPPRNIYWRLNNSTNVKFAYTELCTTIYVTPGLKTCHMLFLGYCVGRNMGEYADACYKKIEASVWNKSWAPPCLSR